MDSYVCVLILLGTEFDLSSHITWRLFCDKMHICCEYNVNIQTLGRSAVLFQSKVVQSEQNRLFRRMASRFLESICQCNAWKAISLSSVCMYVLICDVNVNLITMAMTVIKTMWRRNFPEIIHVYSHAVLNDQTYTINV